MWNVLRQLIQSWIHREDSDADGISVLDFQETSAEAFYSEVAAKKLDFQFENIQLIDSRASTQFTIGSTILPITAGLLASGGNTLSDFMVAKMALFLGFACYLVLTVFVV